MALAYDLDLYKKIQNKRSYILNNAKIFIEEEIYFLFILQNSYVCVEKL